MPISKKQHLAFIKRDIKKAKRTNLLLNAFLITNGCCEECDKIKGTRMPLHEAIKKKPLPYNKCTRKPSCICCYGFEAIRDENGRLIRVKKKWWQRFFN